MDIHLCMTSYKKTIRRIPHQASRYILCTRDNYFPRLRIEPTVPLQYAIPLRHCAKYRLELSFIRQHFLRTRQSKPAPSLERTDEQKTAEKRGFICLAFDLP